MRCTATRTPDDPQPGRAFSCARRHSWGSTLRSVAPATQGRPRVIRTAWPTCRFLCIHPGPFLPGGRSPKTCRLHPRLKAINHGCRSAAPGLYPRGQSVPCRCLHRRPARSILPWAWPLSGLRTPIGALAWLESVPRAVSLWKPLPAPIRSWILLAAHPGNAAAKQLPRTIGVSANPSAY